MALINCPNCNNEVSDMADSCPKCGYVFKSHNPSIQKDAPQTTLTLGKMAKFLKIGALVIAILASVFLIRGFYTKDVYANYSNSDYYYDNEDHINAYVGGDAYKFIINGTYFAGFMALSGTLYICSAGLFCTSILVGLYIKEEPKKDEEDLPSIERV